MSVVLVVGDVSEGVRVWPGKGEEDRHPLVVNSNWENGALIVAGIRMYQGIHTSYSVVPHKHDFHCHYGHVCPNSQPSELPQRCLSLCTAHSVPF